MLRTRNDLSQHIRIHNKIGMLKMNPVSSGFSCNNCKNVCEWGWNLEGHTILKHMEVAGGQGMVVNMNKSPAKKISCSTCGILFRRKMMGGLCPGHHWGELCHRGHHRRQGGQDRAATGVRSWLQGAEALLGRTTRELWRSVSTRHWRSTASRPGGAHAWPKDLQEEEGEVQESRWLRGEVQGSSADVQCLWWSFWKQDLPDKTHEELQPVGGKGGRVREAAGA